MLTLLMRIKFDEEEAFMIYDFGASRLLKTNNEIMQRSLLLQQ